MDAEQFSAEVERHPDFLQECIQQQAAADLKSSHTRSLLRPVLSQGEQVVADVLDTLTGYITFQPRILSPYAASLITNLPSSRHTLLLGWLYHFGNADLVADIYELGVLDELISVHRHRVRMDPPVKPWTLNLDLFVRVLGSMESDTVLNAAWQKRMGVELSLLVSFLPDPVQPSPADWDAAVLRLHLDPSSSPWTCLTQKARDQTKPEHLKMERKGSNCQYCQRPGKRVECCFSPCVCARSACQLRFRLKGCPSMPAVCNKAREAHCALARCSRLDLSGALPVIHQRLERMQERGPRPVLHPPVEPVAHPVQIPEEDEASRQPEVELQPGL